MDVFETLTKPLNKHPDCVYTFGNIIKQFN